MTGKVVLAALPFQQICALVQRKAVMSRTSHRRHRSDRTIPESTGKVSQHRQTAKQVRLDGLKLLLIGLLLVAVTVVIARWLGLPWLSLAAAGSKVTSGPGFVLHGFWHIMAGLFGAVASVVGVVTAFAGVVELIRGKTG